MEDFYTPEAYEWCKRLEFRNLLSRFSEDNRRVEVTDTFETVSDIVEAQKLLEQAIAGEAVGISVCGEKDM